MEKPITETLANFAAAVGEYMDLRVDKDRQRLAKIDFAQAHVKESKAWHRASDLDAFKTLAYAAHVATQKERKRRAVQEYIMAGGIVFDRYILYVEDMIDHRRLAEAVVGDLHDLVRDDSDHDMLSLFYNRRHEEKVLGVLGRYGVTINPEEDLYEEEDVDIPGLECWGNAEQWLVDEGIEQEEFDCTDINPERTEEEAHDMLAEALKLIRQSGVGLEEAITRLRLMSS